MLARPGGGATCKSSCWGFVLLSICDHSSPMCLLISVHCERSNGEVTRTALLLFTLRWWIRDLLLVYCLFTQSSGSGNASLRCSMSSSADFSDDEDYSVKSGSVSPAPGDTLPWNLPRHERSKRKIQGGSVLDPAERAVLRIAGRNPKYPTLPAPVNIHSWALWGLLSFYCVINELHCMQMHRNKPWLINFGF